MTDEIDDTEWGIDRRTVLGTMAGASAMGVLGIPALSGSVAASSHETLYLSDSVDDASGTILFEVTLDDSSGHAQLEKLYQMGATNFNQVDALAASPDGATVYAIDKNSGHLGAYDVVADSFDDLGGLTDTEGGGFPGGVVMAAYSPGGTLYMASSTTDALYSVDPDAQEFTHEVKLDKDLAGTDIAFTADGTLYLIDTRDDSNKALYTVDLTDGSVSKVGTGTGEYFTGLAVRDAGTGDLVGSSTTDDTISVIGRDGSLGTSYPLYLDGDRYGYTFGDMTVGALDVCEELELDLCAGQDTNVGTVTVSESDGNLSITYEMDPDAGWLLYESHVDIGDEFGDLHTNGPGNPKIGNFDLSMEHDGVTEYTYTVECGDAALDDVASDATSLVIATHAVVKPVDGCADFSEFSAGESVEGMGTVVPNLDIQAGYDEAVAAKEGVDPRIYRAPNPGVEDDQDPVKNWGLGLAKSNGVGGGGFADAQASADNEAQSFEFSFADGVTAREFSLRMMDYGDYNPTSAKSHYAEMVAYDENGDMVDEQVLDYTSNGERVSPVIDEDVGVGNGLEAGDDLVTDGDAYSTVDDGVEANLGRYTWQMSGEDIKRVELTFGEGYDPDVAFDNLCFTATDETAWTCEDQDVVERFVERGNWATYFTYDLCDSTGGLDCSTSE